MTMPATDHAQALGAALDQLLAYLQRRALAEEGSEPVLTRWPPSLQLIRERLQLSSFESLVLLLSAALQLDSRFRQWLLHRHGTASLSFELALTLLPDGDWQALLPVSPLRRWQLLTPERPDEPLSSSLQLDEWLLHQLLGSSYLPAALAPWFSPLAVTASMPLAAVDEASRYWQQAPDLAAAPLLVLEQGEAEALVAGLAARLQLRPFRLHGRQLPLDAERLAQLATLWERQALLERALLWVDGEALSSSDETSLALLLDQFAGLVVLSGCRLTLSRPQRRLSLPPLAATLQQQWWQRHLGDQGARINGQLAQLAEQFRFAEPTIARLASDWRQAAQPQPAQLWQQCRDEARQGLDQLAQRITSSASWADLVLPPAALISLQAIVAQARQRNRVYRDWGFGAGSNRGLGISVLFAGGSGTGKTLAAEVIANSLQLDLYRIDLAALVSKYIGETEKNLARVFAAAERSGAILLFDEADALFGKRSEVRDSHDRYANLEVSYLLQRIESYHGLAILTTNLKQALDSAFQRRLRFVVNFPFPDAGARAAIWARVFPPATPTAELDLAKLSRLALCGGHIRNLALTAAFLAADDDGSVNMAHLRRAAEAEFAKLEKPLPLTDVGDW